MSLFKNLVRMFGFNKGEHIKPVVKPSETVVQKEAKPFKYPVQFRDHSTLGAFGQSKGQKEYRARMKGVSL